MQSPYPNHLVYLVLVLLSLSICPNHPSAGYRELETAPILQTLLKLFKNPLQYSCLENPIDRGAWLAIVHGVTKCQTRLSDATSLQPVLFVYPVLPYL